MLHSIVHLSCPNSPEKHDTEMPTDGRRLPRETFIAPKQPQYPRQGENYFHYFLAFVLDNIYRYNNKSILEGLGIYPPMNKSYVLSRSTGPHLHFSIPLFR